MSTPELTADELTLPIKRTEGETIEERLTGNAYHNILPARYLKKDADGDVVEDQEDLFSRVGRNIALAEAVYEAEKRDVEITVRPDQVKPDHPRRDELAEEVFGAGTTIGDDAETALTEDNVNKFAYETVVPELPEGVREHVEEVAEEFTEMMERLSFMPNSPTLMNAGDELQQLSACFVMSPEDDLSDIHEKAKEAAEVFQSGGGVGYAFWKLRPFGDPVGSTGGIASGPLTFMETFDQLCETIAQGGTRRGAQMAIMRVSHPDVIEFIHSKRKDVSLAHQLKLNDPDDFTYTTFSEALEEARDLIDEDGKVPKHLRNAVEGHLSNFNISVGVTDGFMEAVQNDEEYTFTNPRTGEAHIASEETKEMYSRYDLGEYVEPGEELSLPADLVWERIVEGAHENGEPGVVYLDRINDEHSFPVESTPTGDGSEYEILATNPCVTGDTNIATADGRGSVPIEELAAAGEDVPVYCRNEDTGDVEIRTGRDPRLTRRNAELVEVRTDGDVKLRCTTDHEIPTQNRGMVEAADLRRGDSLHILPASRLDSTTSPTPASAANHKVECVEPAGRGDVYNITVDEHHNYFAGIDADEDVFVNVLNCGEQPLMEYEACNLGHINLSTVADLDAPDWRVWSERHGEEYDSLDAAVDAFLEEAIDREEFDHRIEWGTRFLENVVTMSDFPVEKIEETVRKNRKVGLGIMGLAQLYIQLGVAYGSEAANEIARQLMVDINHGSKWASHELAEDRSSFANWEDSKFADPVEYADWFERMTGLDAEEWKDGFPIRNHNSTTIAPTGTTSMVSNTSGGCEPIYNVAYYKNVSDDVQGDEMLVEFDDYFLRTLEANDIDVETVKEEAKEQMATNQFDGVDGLSTVPDAIGELFVTTSDLSAKGHASVQCACQDGVDSAISKTTNAPNDSTVEDAKDVFEYIYDNGGKGVTYYRDGTRSKQVLTTRAQNTEFSDMDEDEATEALLERIEDVFGGMEAFLDRDDVREAIEADVAEVFDIDVEATETVDYSEKRPRPDVLHGVTQRIETGYGKLYVNINEDERGQPFELFATIGNSGGFTNSFTEALAKTVSTALRSGVDPGEIADELQGIRSPKVAWDKGEQIQSIPDAIGTAMRRYLEGDIDRAYPQQRTLEETAEEGNDAPGEAEARENLREAEVDAEPDGGVEAASGGGVNTAGPGGAAGDDASQSLIDAGESPECPSCGSMSLHFSEGCKTCESCGWSEC